jgi:hypothetical protein
MTDSGISNIVGERTRFGKQRKATLERSYWKVRLFVAFEFMGPNGDSMS